METEAIWMQGDSLQVQTRNLTLDIAKGLALLCVFYGHATASSLSSGAFVRCFHIPVFFAIAGFFYRQVDVTQGMRNVVLRYCVPYVYFWVISLVSSFVFARSIIGCIKPSALISVFLYGEPIVNRSLWFLCSLALVYVVSIIIDAACGKYRLHVLVTCLISLAVGILINNMQFGLDNGFLPLHIETIPMGLFFYSIGRLVKLWLARLNFSIYNLQLAISAIAAVLCFYIVYDCVLCGNCTVDLHFGRISPHMIPIAIVGGVGVLFFSQVLYNIPVLKTILGYIGSRSLMFFALEASVGNPVANMICRGEGNGLLSVCMKTVAITIILPFVQKGLDMIESMTSKILAKSHL